MSHVKKGHLLSLEWQKHFRPWLKRAFWHKHRQREKELIRNERRDCDRTG